MPRFSGRLLALALVATGAVVGCASESADGVSEDVAPMVQPSVHVVDADPTTDVEVAADHITAPRDRFPALETFPAGDVIVSGKSAGFLRRIRGTRVVGDQVVVETEPAALDQVFRQVHLNGKLGEPSDDHVSSAPGIGMRGLGIRLPKLSVSHQRLQLGANSEIEILDGDFDFQPDLDFDLVIRDSQVERLKVLASGAAEGSLSVRYDLHVPPGQQSAFFLRSLNNGVTLAETPPYYAVFMAGWVPVVVAVRGRLVANWQMNVGGDVYGEEALGARGSVAAGLQYAGGQWQNLSSKSLSVAANGSPTLVSHQVGGDVTLTARLDVSFYDVAGPYIGLQAYAGAGHQGGARDGWFTEVGVRGLAGAQVAVFGKALVGYEAVLFDVNKQQPL